MSISEWLDCGVVYKLYESMLRLVKDAENVDQRQNCFLIQTSNGVSRYFSMETKQGLLDVQCAWHRSICTSMMHIKVSIYVYGAKLCYKLNNVQYAICVYHNWYAHVHNIKMKFSASGRKKKCRL